MRGGAKGATTVIDVAISVGAGDKRHCEKTTQHERKNSPQSSTEKGNMAVTSMDRDINKSHVDQMSTYVV